MYDRRTSVISSEDMEPTTFDSLRKAAKAIDVTYSALRCAKDKERNSVKKDEKIYEISGTLKMPHSNFKERSYTLNSGVGQCSCGQTFDFVSEKDINMKLRMHCKFCSNPPEASMSVRIPKKAMTLREKQLNEAEIIRRVHEHY